MAIGDTAKLIASLELQDKFSRPAAGITRSLGGMERGFSRIGRGAGQVASGLNTLGTRAALAAAGGLTAVVTTAASMEEAFVGIQKTVDETNAFTFDRLRAELRGMSSDTGTAFEELSRIGEIGGALGVGIEDLEDFIDVVNRLGVSTDLSTDAAATAIGQLRTILHLSGDEIHGFADDLVALGNAGASTEPQIVELAARFAAAGNRAGLSSGEILALSSAVASMGVEVEAGGTALSQTFNNIAKAIGTGSSKVEGFTEVLGISAKEFRTRWETDALGTFQEFLRELSKLDPIAQATALSMAGITGQRQLSTIGLMADNWGFVGGQLEVVANNQDDLNTESNKFFGTAAAGFRKLKENVRLTADTIGVQLLPIVNDLSKEFIDFLQLDSSQAGIKTFAKDLAGGIRGLVTELKGTDFSGIIDGMKLAASVAKGAFDAFRSLPQPIQQLAIAALVANKVSGGAVGSIAGGLANIIGGTIKLAFPKLDIFGRGSPANPMFVVPVGGAGIGGLGGAGGGIAGTGGKPSFLGNLLRVTIVGAVAVEGFNIAADIAGINAPQHEGPDGRGFRATNVPSQELANLVGTLDNLRERVAAGDTFAAKQLTAVEKRIAELRALLAGGIDVHDERNFNAAAATRRLEEAQKGLIADGNRAGARNAQRNIDKLASLIGAVDRTRPILERTAERTSALSARMVEARAATDRGFSATNAQLGVQTSVERGILAKKTSFTANLTVPISTFINASLVQERIVQQRISMGHGFTEGLP